MITAIQHLAWSLGISTISQRNNDDFAGNKSPRYHNGLCGRGTKAPREAVL